MELIKTVLNRLVEFGMSAGIRLVGAILIVVAGFIVINKIIKAIKKSKKAATVEKTAMDFILSFTGISLKVTVLLTAANYLGVPMTSMVAIIGSCGLAVGLALQGSLANLAGGIMILIFKPCRDGDFISVNGFDGTVKEITVLYTYLTTPDNKTVVIPNSVVSSSALINYSMQEKRRVDVSIGVSYKSDVNKVKEILLAFVKDIEFVEKDPAPAVVISSYGDSAITFTIRAWAPSSKYWDVAGAVNYGLQKVLADNNIEIPFPQLDVHLDK